MVSSVFSCFCVRSFSTLTIFGRHFWPKLASTWEIHFGADSNQEEKAVSIWIIYTAWIPLESNAYPLSKQHKWIQYLPMSEGSGKVIEQGAPQILFEYSYHFGEFFIVSMWIVRKKQYWIRNNHKLFNLCVYRKQFTPNWWLSPR